jgi:hypothetical protein
VAIVPVVIVGPVAVVAVMIIPVAIVGPISAALGWDRPALLFLSGADGEKVPRVPDSRAPQQCLVGPYSGDDALRRDGIPRHHPGPWLRSRPSRTSRSY